jgi:hypothetical protein
LDILNFYYQMDYYNVKIVLLNVRLVTDSLQIVQVVKMLISILIRFILNYNLKMQVKLIRVNHNVIVDIILINP